MPSKSKPNRKKKPASSPQLVSSHDSELAQGVTVQHFPASQSQATTKVKKQQANWTAREKELVGILMEEVMNEKQVHLTEKKWEVISDRLASMYGFIRSKTSIKNYWSRNGRLLTGVDERRKPNPEKLVTSVQDPDQRKRARQQISRPSKRHDIEDDGDDSAGEDEEYRGEGDPADGDDEEGPVAKRRKLR